MRKKRTLLFTILAVASLGLTSCSLQEVKSWVKTNLYYPAKNLIDQFVNPEKQEEQKQEEQKDQQEEQKQEEQQQPEHNHTWVYQHDETQHWQVCSECGETKAKENHTGGVADCLHKAHCSICEAEYGDLGEHSYGNLVAQVNATCEQPGVAAHYQCSVCEKYFTEQKVETTLDALAIDAKGHTYGELIAKVDPGCETDGLAAHYHCAECDKYFDSEKHETTLDALKIAKLGHDYGELIAKADADCTHTGVEAHYECSRCHKLFDSNKEEKSLKQLTIAAKGHSGVLHAAAPASCTEAGNSAYYVCSACGKFFSDEQCTHEIEENSWVIAAKGHSGVLHPANAPSCEEAGNSAYYVCSDCGKFFSDEQCTHEIEEDSWVIAAKGHSGVLHAANAPSCEEAGNSAYYVCSDCGKFFSDEQCTHEINENSWVIAATGHTYGSLVPELMPDGVNDGHAAYYQCSECNKYFDENHVETTLANLTYDASGDLITLAKSVQGSAFNANASFDMRCEAQTGYGLHFHANEEFNNWPTVKIELRESHDLTNASIAVVGKFVTTKPRLAFKFYDSSNALVSYGWQTAIDFLGTTSYTDLMDWTQKTVTNANMVAALQSGKDLTDVKFIEIGVDFNANHGIVQDAYVDELHIIDNVYAANTSSVANLEMGTYSAGQWRGYGSTPTIVYDTYGANSYSALKVTFQDTTATLPGRVYASFDLAQTTGIGTSNTIDVKNSTLSFDIKLSQEFYDANNSQFTFKHEDSSWSGIEKWYSYPGYSTGNPNTWLHVSIDLSAKYGSETRNANTYAITFGFFGMTAETAQTAWVIFDNLSITPNA